jgi:S1-C subfamily serine protease
MTKLPVAVAAAATLLVAGCGQSELPTPRVPNALTDQQLIDHAAKGVVAIRVKTATGEAVGTGWVVSPQEIITAAHVVSGAQEVTIRFKDGSRVPARVTGASMCNDRALLQLTREVPNMTVLPMASGEALDRNAKLDLIHYGTNAVTDFGHEELTTSPLTVANPRIHEPELGASFPGLTDLVQLQGVVPQGASGGAVLDADGLVRGMAVITETQQSQGYAVPVGQLRNALAAMRNGERTDSLGAELTPIGDIDLSELFGNDPDFTELDPDVYGEGIADIIERNDIAGLYISSVADNTPAAGNLGYGDMITQVNGVRVRTVKDLCGVLGSAGAGDSISISGSRINAGTPEDVLNTWSATVTLG